MTKEGHFQEGVLDDIAKAYRQIYQCGTSLENAIRRIREIIPEGPEIHYMLDFIESSRRGIIGTSL